MPGIYSISKINCFGNCRLQYKYHYIDKIEAEIEGIEAFLGKRVHEALEELYMAVKNRVVRPLDWVLEKYKELWDKNAHDSLKIVKSEYTINDYYMKGRKILEEYYLKYHPFDRTKVVSTEQNMNFSIKDGKYELRGVLDRLDWNDKENIYEIHDYKTSATLPTQEDADKDEQLGLYHIALKQYWKETERVKLVWHYLLFNKEIISYKSDAELLDLENSIARKIEEIEGCAEYPPRQSGLCPYCGYQDICPLWKHPQAMQKA